MKEITLKGFKFKSYVHLSFAMGMSLGVAMGITLFTLSFFSQNVTFTWGGNQTNGIPAGIASLIFCPFFGGLAGALYGVVGFFPFKLLMKIQKKLNLVADYEIPSSDTEAEPVAVVNASAADGKPENHLHD